MEVNGFENYLIYPSGKVYSKKSKIYLKLCDDTKYLNLNLYKDGKPKTHRIHKLLAEHFIENPDNKRCVDHIDRNRKNNKLNNLRWATHSENSQNTIEPKDNKSGIKNIFYDKINNRYRYVKMIRRVKHEKYFKTIEEAIEYKTIFENNM